MPSACRGGPAIVPEKAGTWLTFWRNNVMKAAFTYGMPEIQVVCDRCGGAAAVKAELPVYDRSERLDSARPATPRESRQLIYCPRCGMRSQPAAQADD
jgi:hypothetical protein